MATWEQLREDKASEVTCHSRCHSSRKNLWFHSELKLHSRKKYLSGGEIKLYSPSVQEVNTWLCNFCIPLNSRCFVKHISQAAF